MFGQKNRGWGWGKKHANDWFHDEYAQKKKAVKRALKRFQKSKKTGKRMLAKEKNTSKEGNRV